MSSKYEKDGIVFELVPSDSVFLTDKQIASNDKMYITIPDSELYLHSAYCLFGQDTFEIVQDDINKVKIYDSDSNLIWNGWK